MLSADTLAVSLGLLIAVATAAAFSFLLAASSRTWQNPHLCVLSLVTVAIAHWQSFIGFSVVNAIAFLVLRWLGEQKDSTNRWRWACVLLFALIAVFTLGRILLWETSTFLVGSAHLTLYSFDMWFALRLATLFWEVGSGAVVAPPLSKFLIWTSLPLTFGGPVLRYSQLPTSVVPDPSQWRSSTWWLTLGAGTLKLIAGLTLGIFQWMVLAVNSGPTIWAKAAVALVTAPGGFYLTYAGYFQLMESFGRLCGFSLPTSFNLPFGRENISAFWANWNMSATAVFRDYLFFTRWGRHVYNPYFNSIILFSLVGLWHAANLYWLLWGFLHGLLFCTFLAWRRHATSVVWLPLQGTLLSRTAGALLTYGSVCACWYLPSKILQKFHFS